MFTIGAFIAVYKKTGLDLTRPEELGEEVDLKQLSEVTGVEINSFKELVALIYLSFSGGEKMAPKKREVSNNSEEEGFNLVSLIELAGACELSDYKSLYPWELFAYCKGYNKSQWSRLSCLLALINNAHCFKRKDLKKPIDFNPTISHSERVAERQRASRDFSELINNGSFLKRNNNERED